MNIVLAMQDENLFGPTFGGDSFAAWRVLLAGFYGLQEQAGYADIWKAVTGAREWPERPLDELWLAVGRRGGKSQVGALIAVFEAAFRDHRDKLAPGEWATAMLIAADRAQARTLLRYVRGLFEHPMLTPLIVRETTNGLELNNRTAIEVATASFRSVRGYTLAAVIADEIAFWTTDGVNPDIEIIAALRPALATLGGKLVALSSPYSKRGMLWQTYQGHFGQDSRVLIAQAPSTTMNSTLPQRVIDDAMNEDPARASAEYLAQFRNDIQSFLGVDLISEAIRSEPLVLPWRPNTLYEAFVDPSGGGKDEFTLAIGHRETDGRVIVDLVTGRRGNPASITAEVCNLVRQYRVQMVRGDKYAAEWSRTEFRRNKVNYFDAPGTRSELYLSAASALNAGRVELPPDDILARQFAALERRTTRTGRDLIDHPPGQHDDRANAVAGLIAVLSNEQARVGPLVGRSTVCRHGTSSLSATYG